MAQGTVTDYFLKKRKGSVVQASKRLKFSPSVPEDARDSASLSLSGVTPKSAAKRSRRGNTKIRQRKLDKNASLDLYFPKKNDFVTTGDEQNTEEIDSKSVLPPELLPISQNFTSNTKENVAHKDTLSSNDPVLFCEGSTDVSSRPTCSKDIRVGNSGDLKTLTNNKESITSEKTTSSAKGPQTNLVERLKKASGSLIAKETPETLTEKLKTKGDLKSLQDSLMKIRQLKKQRAQSEKTLPDVPAIDKSSQDATAKTRSPQKREYAYETLHSLAQEIPEGLPLPYKYKILSELFRCTDIVVGMLYNRKQVVTWSNLQKSVQEMARKNFELHHLAQMKTVFPTGYEFRQEKGVALAKDRGAKFSAYQLTVEPMFDESDRFGGEKKLSSGMLAKRRHHFMLQLINIVHTHHVKFLSQLDPPINVPEGRKIRRWHPQFPLDMVPSPAEAELPQPPNKDDRCSNAKDILEKARSRFTKRAFDALKKVAEKASSPEKVPPPVCVEENNNEPFVKNTSTMKPVEIKGVPQSLLAKVRAKEAERKMKCMVRSEEHTKILQQLDNLPDIARALRMLYTSEKRASLPVEYVCKKLVKCSTGVLTEMSVEEHIRLLVKTVPDWLTSIKVKTSSYVKMNKSMEMNVILARLAAERKETEKLV